MPDEDDERSADARAAAELALVRVVHHYGAKPEFVLLGGLVPQLLCSESKLRHAGTTDIDVQVDLEIAGGAVNAKRLEQALRNAEFSPSAERTWRWEMTTAGGRVAVIKFELLADLDTAPQAAVIEFAECVELGAVNLRGTGYATRDTQERTLRAKDGGVMRQVLVNVTGLSGFLLAKAAAAHGRHKPKDWYDVAFVLLNNDEGDHLQAAARVLEVFGPPTPSARTWLIDLQANFADANCPGSDAYARGVMADHPEQDPLVLSTDAHLVVTEFCHALLSAAQR